MYKVLIADDEQLAIDLIVGLLNLFPEFEVVDTLTCANDIIPAIHKTNPDLLLLDINLGLHNGINIAGEIKSFNHDLQIIFNTAHAEYALDAYESYAVDYFLKPVSVSRLTKALNHFKEYYEAIHSNKQSMLLSGALRFNTKQGFILIKPEDIIYLEADNAYTLIHTSDNRIHHVSLNIGRVEELLANNQFIRISRSGIVNSNFITEVSKKKSMCQLRWNGSSHDMNISHSGIERIEKIFG